MDWQLLIVGVLVALALVYLARQSLRTWRGQRPGCGGCGKHSSGTKALNAVPSPDVLIPVEQLRLRRR